MPEGIGQVNFFQSIISYFTLFACLGIPAYAVRKTATIRENPQELSKVTTEILILNGALTFICYLGVIIVCCTISRIAVNIPLFLIMSLSIVLTSMGCEWFYQGIEDFKYISIRGIIVKTTAAILLFVFVRSQTDLWIYGIYTVISSVGGNIFNMIRLRKHVYRHHFTWRELRPLAHLAGTLKMFIIVALTSIYLNTASIILGFLKTNVEVGYYAAAYRISRIAIELSVAMGAVILPRMSNLFAKGEMSRFKELAQKSYNFVVTVTLPIATGMGVIASLLVPVFCGNEFIPAINTLIWLAPVVFFVGLAHVISYQILLPQNKEHLLIIGAIVGLIINIILNVILIPRFAQNGAAIATLVTEFAVTITMIIIGRRFIPIKFLNIRNLVRIIGTFIMGTLGFYMAQIGLANGFVCLGLTILSCIIFYISYLLLTRDPLLRELFQFLHIHKHQ